MVPQPAHPRAGLDPVPDPRPDRALNPTQGIALALIISTLIWSLIILMTHNQLLKLGQIEAARSQLAEISKAVLVDNAHPDWARRKMDEVIDLLSQR